jgi:signal transduction histidine kinase
MMMLPQADESARIPENAQERIHYLNQEKSFLQLIITLMNKIRSESGLDHLIDNTLQGLMGVIGGTNVILVYQCDTKLCYADLYRVKKQIQTLDDDLISVAFSTGLPREIEHDFSASRMMTPEFCKAYSWAYPLVVGPQVIGVLKIENLHISMSTMSPQLPTLFSFIATNLKNEIFEHSRLKKVLQNLEQEVAARRAIENELRQNKEQLEERVEERTTELIQLEQKYQQTQKLESLGVLAGGIAHDFNNILTIILGHCYMIKSGVATKGVTDKDQLDLIESAANRAAGLCRQMLAYAGKSPAIQTEFNMSILVADVIVLLTSASSKNVTFKLELEHDLPPIVGDSSQIQQVVMNLVINASEAIGENIGVITIGLHKSAIRQDQCEIDYFGSRIPDGNYARLVVSDTGSGMCEESKRRIFEPFYTTKFTGRGLGMSAILGIIKAHNGALQLNSTEGVGTEFTVFIPHSVGPKPGDTI